MQPVSDEQLFSWVERDAAELEAYLRAHPEARARVDGWRATTDAARESSGLPAAIAGFRVVRLLGRGGMGVVYEAEEALPKRRVALKLLPGAIDAAGLARFERECAALGRLAHPGIATLHAAGRTAAGEPYLVMELVAGGPLGSRIAEARWPRRARLELFAELCEAMAAAHAAGIVHRDLKPGNVLVTPDGRPKVVDFGLALLRDDARVTQPGAALGTLAYASPEQLRGGEVDARTDVWSLGVVLHELLTGRTPFAPGGSDVAALVHAIDGDAEPRPSRLDRSLRGDLDAIVLRCLERDPARRYAGAAELADDVRRHLGGRPISARPPSGVELAWRFLRRNRVATGLALGVVGLAASGVALGLALRGGAGRGPDFERPLVGRGYVEAAPWPALRWRGTTPQVEVDGRFLELVAIDGLRAELVLGFCRQTAGSLWVKRFTEDLGQVLERMTGRPTPPAVVLTLRDPATEATFERRDVAMRADHRRALWSARRTSPFTRARVATGPPRIEVEVSGAWHELLGAGGGDAAALLAELEDGFGEDPGAALLDRFHELFESAFDRPVPQPLELELRRLDDGVATTIADAVLLAAARRSDGG